MRGTEHLHYKCVFEFCPEARDIQQEQQVAVFNGRVNGIPVKLNHFPLGLQRDVRSGVVLLEDDTLLINQFRTLVVDYCL